MSNWSSVGFYKYLLKYDGNKLLGAASHATTSLRLKIIDLLTNRFHSVNSKCLGFVKLSRLLSHLCVGASVPYVRRRTHTHTHVHIYVRTATDVTGGVAMCRLVCLRRWTATGGWSSPSQYPVKRSVKRRGPRGQTEEVEAAAKKNDDTLETAPKELLLLNRSRDGLKTVHSAGRKPLSKTEEYLFLWMMLWRRGGGYWNDWIFGLELFVNDLLMGSLAGEAVRPLISGLWASLSSLDASRIGRAVILPCKMYVPCLACVVDLRFPPDDFLGPEDSRTFGPTSVLPPPPPPPPNRLYRLLTSIGQDHAL